MTATPSSEDARTLSHPPEKVPQGEQRFYTFFEQAAVGMAMVTVDGQFIQINQKFCDQLGYDKEELLQKTFQQITHPDDLAGDLAYVEQLLAGELSSYAMEKRYIRKDGTPFWVRLNTSLVQDEQGEPQYFIGTVENIEERKRLEATILQQQQALEAAARNAEAEQQRLFSLLLQTPACICILRGPEHMFAFANENYQQLFGSRNLIGKTIREALPEVAGQGFFELLDQVYTTDTPFIGDGMHIQLDRHNTGTLEDAYFNFVYQPTKNSQGVVDGIFVHAVEVTDLVQARENASNSKQRLEIAQRAGRIGTFDWDIQENEILWTPELELLYGLPAGGFEGKYQNWEQRVHPDDLPEAAASLLQAIQENTAYNTEFRIIWPDGSIHWLKGRGEITEFDEQGRPAKMIGVNIDITESKEAQQEKDRLLESLQEWNTNLENIVQQRTSVLRQLNTELQRSNQELQEFAYVASHDLQEPLRKIQAFGNLLIEEYGDQLSDGKEYLERMRNAASRMRVLIDDLLTFSRVTTKAMPFTPVDLNTVIRQVLDDLEPRLQATQGKVEVGPLPIIDADAGQMHQLFQNLLTNAVKFHKPDVHPYVKVSAEFPEQTTDSETGTETSNKQCVIYVQDNGIGFDEKYLDRIFTVFQRLHGRGQFEGTGIGLAVVRKIVERHYGAVTATSSVGNGATFIVTLPMTQQQAQVNEEEI